MGDLHIETLTGLEPCRDLIMRPAGDEDWQARHLRAQARAERPAMRLTDAERVKRRWARFRIVEARHA